MFETWGVPIIAIGGLIFFHELGHYIAARLVKVKVEEFAIGFPPRVYSKVVKGTRYSLGLLFLGGFVRLRGQNLDDEDPNEPGNYAAKSKRARLFIIAAGPAVNILLAVGLLIFAYKLGVEEPAYLDSAPAVIEQVPAESFAKLHGFLPGDKILTLNDAPVENWRGFYNALLAAPDELAVLVQPAAGGGLRTISFDKYALPLAGFGFSHLIPPTIGKLTPGMPAVKAGLKSGDQILMIDDQAINSFSEVAQTLQQGEGKLHKVKIARNFNASFEELTIEVAPQFDAAAQAWRLGFGLPMKQLSYSWTESIKLSLNKVGELSTALGEFLTRLFSGGASSNEVGGPIMIGKILGDAAASGVYSLLVTVAFISLQLGILNLLPLPVLDGGHIAFLGYEWLAGRQPSAAIRSRINGFFMALLLGLMVFMVVNDLLKL